MTLSALSLHPQQQLGANRRVSAPCSCYPRSYILHLTAPHWHVYGKIASRRAHLQRVSPALPPFSHFPRVRLMPLHPPASAPDHSPTSVPPRPPLLGFIPPSPLRHLSRNQFGPAASHRHGMLAKGDGVRSGFSATTFPLPPYSDLLPPLRRHRRYFAAFPQLARYSSGVARQHDRTALCGVISHIM